MGLLCNVSHETFFGAGRAVSRETSQTGPDVLPYALFRLPVYPEQADTAKTAERAGGRGAGGNPAQRAAAGAGLRRNAPL